MRSSAPARRERRWPPDKEPMSEESFSTALGELSDAQGLADFVRHERERLRAAFVTAPSGRAHSLAWCALFDTVVARLFQLAAQEAQATVFPTGVEIAVLATGGYGRRELCPRSDNDIAFVAAEEEDSYIDALIRRVFFWIMDVFTVRSDVQVGYAFRVLDECAELDPQTRTALFDGRCIAGSEALARRFRRMPARSGALHGRRFRAAVRQKRSATVHRTEPDKGAGSSRLQRQRSRVPIAARADDPWAFGGVWRRGAGQTRARRGGARVSCGHATRCITPARRFDVLDAREEALALGYDDPQALMAEYYHHRGPAATPRRWADGALPLAMPGPASRTTLGAADTKPVAGRGERALFGKAVPPLAMRRSTLPPAYAVATGRGEVPSPLMEICAPGAQTTLRRWRRGVLQRLIRVWGGAALCAGRAGA